VIERERDMSSLLVGGSLLFLLYQLSELTIREFCFLLVALAVCCLRKREKVVPMWKPNDGLGGRPIA
jgi:hypothetical protein